MTTGRLPYEQTPNDNYVPIEIDRGVSPASLDDHPSLDNRVRYVLQGCWMIDPNSRPTMEENYQKLTQDADVLPFRQGGLSFVDATGLVSGFLHRSYSKMASASSHL